MRTKHESKHQNKHKTATRKQTFSFPATPTAIFCKLCSYNSQNRKCPVTTGYNKQSSPSRGALTPGKPSSHACSQGKSIAARGLFSWLSYALLAVLATVNQMLLNAVLAQLGAIYDSAQIALLYYLFCSTKCVCIEIVTITVLQLLYNVKKAP